MRRVAASIGHRLRVVSIATITIAAVLTVAPTTAGAAGEIFVDLDATGANDGSSWADAFTDLDDALAAAGSGDPVWVAEGVYTPDASDRTNPFSLVSNSTIYGGFDGTETDLSQRNPSAHPTILSGDLAADDDGGGSNAENSYTVLVAADNSRLDGFVIEGGHANGTLGSFGNPNERIEVDGPAIFTNGAIGFVLANSVIRDNAGSSGTVGAVSFENGAVDIINTTFDENSTPGLGVIAATVNVSNTLFTETGGAMLTGPSGPNPAVVTWNNVTLAADGLVNGSSLTVHNSILWPPTPVVVNFTVSDSNVRGSGGTGSNIDVDPQFVDPANGNYRLLSTSPSIDAGDNASVPSDSNDADNDGDFGEAHPDLDLGDRIIDTVDHGAYEGSCPSRHYVDGGANGADDGTTWSDAFDDLQEALAVVSDCDFGEVWVAEGVYRPSGADRSASFLLTPFAQVFGGFDGTETALSERDPAANPTTLSGNIGLLGITADNSYHVVRSEGANDETRLDGFIVTAGRASGSGPDSRGAGVQVEDGGSPLLANLIVRGNVSDSAAGGVSLAGTSGARIVSSILENNTTQGDGGNLRLGNNVDARIINTVISGGSADDGGGMYDNGSSSRFENVTIGGNTAASNPAVRTAAGSDLSFDNSIIWDVGPTFAPAGTVSYRASNVQRSGGSGAWDLAVGIDGGGNIDADPLFAGAQDFGILGGSPSIDAGDQTLAPSDVRDIDDDGDTAELVPDVERQARLLGPEIDQGAYESASCPSGPIHVDASSPAFTPDGSSWSLAFTDLQAGLDAAAGCGVDVWVADGTYVPSTSGDINERFVVGPDTTVIGGFDGGEATVADRDLDVHVATLSGDLDANDVPGAPESDPSRADNSGVVVQLTGGGNRLDGVTVSGGNGTGLTGVGGMVQVLDDGGLIINTRLEEARGLAALRVEDGATVTVLSSVVEDTDEAVAALDGSDVAIVNGEFVRAGRIASTGSADVSFVNATIVAGSLLVNSGSTLSFENSIARSLSSISGLGSLSWADSNVEGSGGSASWDPTFGTDEGGNIDADPLFVDPANDRYRLLPGSPSLDAGDTSVVPVDLLDIDDDGITSERTPDVERLDRVVGAEVDQGASEGPCSTLLYVDLAAGGANDGMSWANAFTDLGVALEVAARCSAEIWVAAGAHVPGSGSPARTSTFDIASGVAVYGGFDGTETDRTDRAPATNLTVLSGDLAQNGAGNDGDDAYTVVTIVDADPTTVLDGFAVTEGDSDGFAFAEQRGGGIFLSGGSPALSNLFVAANTAENRGGGIHIRGGSTATLTNIILNENASDSVGGGVWIGDDARPLVSNLLANDNLAENGGGVGLASGAALLVNSTITDNTATDGGGGLFVGSGSHEVVNSIAVDNAAVFGPLDVDVSGGAIEWSFSSVEGSGGSLAWDSAFGTDGGDNVDLPADFVAPALNDFRLSAASPLIDLGDSSALPVDAADLDRDGDTSEALPLDLFLGDRVLGSAVDLGAYEGAGACPGGGRVYVDASNNGPFNGLTWNGAFDDLQVALGVAATCPGLEIWVAAGTYLPTDGTDRTISFVVPSGTRLYGGFAGGETSLDDRDVLANATQLSGDLDGDEQPVANAQHVVVLDNAGPSTVVDGFTILHGNADGIDDNSKGGGVLVLDGSPLLANLTVLRNQAIDGGGVAIIGGSARFQRSIVRDNVGVERGGGVRIEAGATASLVNVQITDNEAEFFAAGVHVVGADPSLINLTVTSNETVDGGVNASVGIDIDALSAATLDNVITYGNVGGGAGRSDLKVGSTDTATSFSIVGSNSSWNTVLYGSDGGDNLFVDPQFADPVARDYSLSGLSPGIDSGTPAPIPADADDLDNDGDTTELLPPLRGSDRDLRTEVDRGAYEAVACQPVFFVDIDAAGSGDGSSWTDAVPELREALVLAQACPGSDLWVAEGTYLPTGDGDRAASFGLIDGVGIYGGFDGSEAALSERSVTANETILSGDLDGNDAASVTDTAAADRADNSTTVVDASGRSSTAVLDGFTISGGNSDSTDQFDTGFNGGGVLIDGGSATLTGNTIEDNSARAGGGLAILAGATPDLSDTIVEDNWADLRGGGVLISGASPEVVDLSVVGNVSGDESGGFHIVDGSPVLRRATVSGNQALGSSGFAVGGGIGIVPNVASMTVTILDSEIFLNTAPYGGGIGAEQTGVPDVLTVVVASSQVVANEATIGTGGGLYVTDADLVLVSSGVGSNSSVGAGGAIFHDDGEATVVNTTVVGNESDALVDGIRLLGSGSVSNSIVDESANVAVSSVTVAHSLIVGSGGSGAGWTLSAFDGGNNIDTDPLFVDAVGGDLHLTAASPAIDTGDTALVPVDAPDADDDGNVAELAPDLDLLDRVSGTAVDMGAYEFGAPPTPVGAVFTPVGSCVVGDSSSFGPLDGLSVTVFQVAGTLPLGQGAEAGSCGVPVGASAVLVNVVAKDPLIGGNLRASAAGVPASGGVVNFAALSPPLENSNAVVVPLSSSGEMQIEVNCGGPCSDPTTDVRLTVLGFYDEASGAADEFSYVPVTPCAAFDSRANQAAAGGFVGPYDAGEQRTFQISGSFAAGQGGGNTDCGVPTGASAVMVNLVALNSAVSGDVAIGAGGSDPVEPVLSHAPLSPQMNNANAVIVPLDASGQLVVEAQGALGATDMAEMRGVVLGYLTEPDDGAEYFPVAPCAAFDSRTNQGATGGFAGAFVDEETRTYAIGGVFDAAQGGGNTTCGVPVGADAVLINLVAINASLEGNLRVAATGTVATGGVVNFASLTPSMNNSNAIIVPLSALGELDVTANLGVIAGVPGVEVRGVILGYLD